MGGFVSIVSYSCQTFMTFVSASLVGAFTVIVKLRVIFAKVRLKLYWSPVTSPAQGPATDRMLDTSLVPGSRRKLGLEMQSLIWVQTSTVPHHTTSLAIT